MSFRAISLANNGNGGTTLAVTIPAGAQVGDYVLIPFEWGGNATVTSVASSNGSTLTTVIAYAVTGSVGASICYGLTVAAGDPGSTVTITLSATSRTVGCAYVESNATGALDGTGRTAVGTSSTISIPSVDPTLPNRRQIAFYGGADTSSGVSNSLGDLTGTVTPWTTRGFTRTTNASLKNTNLAVAERTLPGDTATSVATSTAALSLSFASGMTVLLVSSDAPPTANAGADQSVNPAATVTLNGTGSTDPESGALTYAWTQLSGPAVTLSSATAAQPTFTAPATVDGATLVFGLTVTDPVGQASAPDTVTITAAPGPFMYRRESGGWIRRKLYRRIAGAWVWP